MLVFVSGHITGHKKQQMNIPITHSKSLVDVRSNGNKWIGLARTVCMHHIWPYNSLVISLPRIPIYTYAYLYVNMLMYVWFGQLYK
jgi:hypothetical protein